MTCVHILCGHLEVPCLFNRGDDFQEHDGFDDPGLDKIGTGIQGTLESGNIPDDLFQFGKYVWHFLHPFCKVGPRSGPQKAGLQWKIHRRLPGLQAVRVETSLS